MFGYYLPEPVVQRLAIERQGSDWLKPERREMTILFADIQGFTAMAEMLPPEVVANITKQLFTNLTGVIHEHQGTVDKYMGDAVMAFWGAPLLDDQHALHAAKAALAMQAVVSQLNTAVFSQQNINIHLGIGINTGVVVVGNLGSEQRHAYTVMGGAVNAASAIQQLTRHYPYDILAGEETASQLPASIQVDLGSAETRKLPHKLRVFAITDAC
jgi:adenylate cyclase